MFIIRNNTANYYASLGASTEGIFFPVMFVWTQDKADAVRFASLYHAKAVRAAFKRKGFETTIVRVP